MSGIEALSRIRAILRRTSNDTTTTHHESLQTSGLTLYPEKRQTVLAHSAGHEYYRLVAPKCAAKCA